MQFFMSEKEALAVIEENIKEIEVKMASGQSSVYSTNDADNQLSGNNGNACTGGANAGCSCCVC